MALNPIEMRSADESETIREIAGRAVRTAHDERRPVIVRFGEVSVYVGPSSTITYVVDQYHRRRRESGLEPD